MAKKQSGFAAEFAKQRAALGAGKTFTYQGKTYSTNRADDKPGVTSSPRPKAKPVPAAPKPAPMPNRAAGTATPAAPKMRPSAPAPKPAPMASSPRPKPRPAEATAAAGGARKPNADGKYSPTTEMRMRSSQPAAMPSLKPKPKPAGMTSPRPMARSAEMMTANGGARKANANRKYSPTEEMRLRNMKKD